MNRTQITTYHGFDYRLVQSDEYGFGLESRPFSKLPETWTDVVLMPKGELEGVMKRILECQIKGREVNSGRGWNNVFAVWFCNEHRSTRICFYKVFIAKPARHSLDKEGV